MTAITKLAGNFVETDIDEEIVIMRLDNGDLLSLADTAATAWRLIDGRRDRAALEAALAAEYDADPQEIASDIGLWLQQMKDTGLIAEG